MNLIFVHLKEVKFVETNTQVVGYQKAVKEWMTQWTTGNNYHPVIAEPGNMMSEAMDAMREDFFSMIRYHFLGVIPVEYRALYNYKKDFEFGFLIQQIELGTPFYLTGALNWVEGDAK
jgi:hypothetical protein